MIGNAIASVIGAIKCLLGIDPTPDRPSPEPARSDDVWMDNLMRKTIAERVWYDHGGKGDTRPDN